MIEKYISLLENQINKLDEKGFDLEAWKSSTIVFLARIFGDQSEKIKQIDKIKFEFGSWSLRDASGHSDQMASCKSRGRAILEACITELQLLGLEEESINSGSKDEPVIDALSEELKMSQVRELKSIVSTKESRNEKIDQLTELLKNYGSEVAPRIVSQILTNPKNSKLL